MEQIPDDYDYALLRMKVRRIVNSEIQMLSSALQALKENKLYVVQDHIERVIQSLEKLNQ